MGCDFSNMIRFFTIGQNGMRWLLMVEYEKTVCDWSENNLDDLWLVKCDKIVCDWSNVIRLYMIGWNGLRKNVIDSRMEWAVLGQMW